MTAETRKVIITCAVTGAVHTPSMSEFLPISPQQIASSAIEAAQAGAAILHIHARRPEDGRPSGDPDVYRQILPAIAQATDAVINLTTGASTHMTLAERLQYPQSAAPEMCSLNMGSMNFSIHPVAEKIGAWRFPWEQAHIAGMKDRVFRNTFADIEHILSAMAAHGTRFELECYDVGHLYNLAYFVERGAIKPPLFIQTIYGILGGVGPDPECLFSMRATADRLFGRDNYLFSVLGAGRHQMPLLTLGAIMGANVRVGLEDSIYLSKGVKAQSNAEQVRKIRRILEELSLEIASPADARAMLHLKGRDRVGF